MTNLPPLADMDAQTAGRLARIVVVDHPDGTDVYGVDGQGEQITDRLKFFGNLPWGAVLSAAQSQADFSFFEPGTADEEPDTGFPRYSFPASARR